jgi:hypothetical protein
LVALVVLVVLVVVEEPLEEEDEETEEGEEGEGKDGGHDICQREGNPLARLPPPLHRLGVARVQSPVIVFGRPPQKPPLSNPHHPKTNPHPKKNRESPVQDPGHYYKCHIHIHTHKGK